MRTLLFGNVVGECVHWQEELVGRKFGFFEIQFAHCYFVGRQTVYIESIVDQVCEVDEVQIFHACALKWHILFQVGDFVGVAVVEVCARVKIGDASLTDETLANSRSHVRHPNSY